MKLSMETYTLLEKFDEESSFAMLKAAGFDSIDFSFYWLSDEKAAVVFGDQYLEYAQNVRTFLDKIGLTCNQAHSPFVPLRADQLNESNAAFMTTVKSIRSAAVMGAKAIIIHPLRASASETLLETNIKFYKSFEPYCKECGIKIGVENVFSHPYDKEKKRYIGQMFGKPEEMRELMAVLGTEHYTVCVDVGHAAVVGGEPHEYIKGMNSELLGALHIHDNNYDEDDHMLPYFGTFAWDKITAALKEIGYKGDFTLEIFGSMYNLDRDLMIKFLDLAGAVGKKLINMIEK